MTDHYALGWLCIASAVGFLTTALWAIAVDKRLKKLEGKA